MNRLYPANTRLKEGPNATRLRPEQVGIFPCRGEVAPCQRAPGSIKELPVRCQTREGGGARQRVTRAPRMTVGSQEFLNCSSDCRSSIVEGLQSCGQLVFAR